MQTVVAQVIERKAFPRRVNRLKTGGFRLVCIQWLFVCISAPFVFNSGARETEQGEDEGGRLAYVGTDSSVGAAVTGKNKYACRLPPAARAHYALMHC
jgi:hypothetical protein